MGGGVFKKTDKHFIDRNNKKKVMYVKHDSKKQYVRHKGDYVALKDYKKSLKIKGGMFGYVSKSELLNRIIKLESMLYLYNNILFRNLQKILYKIYFIIIKNKSDQTMVKDLNWDIANMLADIIKIDKTIEFDKNFETRNLTENLKSNIVKSVNDYDNDSA